MRTLLIASALLTVPASAVAQNPSAEELTRLLNGAPPAAARPAPQPQPTTTLPAQVTAPVSAPAPVQRPAPTSAAPAASRAAPAPSPAAAPARAASATTPVVPARAASNPSPTPAPAPAAAAAAPGALSPAAIAALPFRIDLPSGFQIVEGRGAPDAKVWSVRKAGKTFVMIYAGPSSQFPIYDGEQVQAAGRVTVVVPEGTRRIAMEHLFQRPTAPAEVHVWLMSLGGADRDAAERIGQSVDPK